MEADETLIDPNSLQREVWHRDDGSEKVQYVAMGKGSKLFPGEGLYRFDGSTGWSGASAGSSGSLGLRIIDRVSVDLDTGEAVVDLKMRGKQVLGRWKQLTVYDEELGGHVPVKEMLERIAARE
jgi:hypothetical protein